MMREIDAWYLLHSFDLLANLHDERQKPVSLFFTGSRNGSLFKALNDVVSNVPSMVEMLQKVYPVTFLNGFNAKGVGLYTYSNDQLVVFHDELLWFSSFVVFVVNGFTQNRLLHWVNGPGLGLHVFSIVTQHLADRLLNVAKLQGSNGCRR